MAAVLYKESPDEANTEALENNGGPRFTPQLYIQRYGFVREILYKHQVKSIVDIGSAQCKILTLLKTVPSLESITLIDNDKPLLESNKFCIKPLLFDFLHRREKPLTVRIFHGDATQLDTRLTGSEAVSMVEFIEHLEAIDLERVTECVFGEIRPKLVIITTPNSEFNTLFPNFTGFRHWDHKFEWTRTEFQTWCGDICSNYSYSVTYNGIGDPPEEYQHLGHCSQAAIFTQLDTSSSVDPRACHCHTLVAECEYPYQEYKQSPEEKLHIEVQYCIHQLTLNSDLEEGEGHTVIPLEKLLCFRKIQDLCDITTLRDHLQCHYTLSADGEHVLVPLELEDCECDIRDDEAVITEEEDEKWTVHDSGNVVIPEEEWWD